MMSNQDKLSQIVEWAVMRTAEGFSQSDIRRIAERKLKQLMEEEYQRGLSTKVELSSIGGSGTTTYTCKKYDWPPKCVKCGMIMEVRHVCW